MKKIIFLIPILCVTLYLSGCSIVDPFIFALGLPLDVCATVTGGSTWDEEETYNVRDEITGISASYLEDVRASRVNDVRVYMPDPPATGNSSGSLSYAIDAGALLELATWTDVPFPALAEPGISIVSSGLVTLNGPNFLSLLTALQDTTGLPAITSVTVATDGMTSVTVAAGTQVCVVVDYQIDVED